MAEKNRIILQELLPNRIRRTFEDGSQDEVPYGPGLDDGIHNGSVPLDPNNEIWPIVKH